MRVTVVTVNGTEYRDLSGLAEPIAEAARTLSTYVQDEPLEMKVEVRDE